MPINPAINAIIRKDLTDGKVIESCPFCSQQPQFRQWPERELVVFGHKCAMVDHTKVCFPYDADLAIAYWNDVINAAADRLIKKKETT